MLVHLDGAIVPLAQARISPEDRAFLFADAVYEALVARDGRLLLWEPHERRLRAGLAALRLPFDDPGPLRAAAEELLVRNELQTGDAALYLQISRGAAPRNHAFPSPPVPPTVYMSVRRYHRHGDDLVAAGVPAITVADNRWARCDVKSTALLANVLAQQEAREAGAHEAIFVRDGMALEGSHSNLFAVRGGELFTYPASNYILEGVTRNELLALAPGLGIPVRLCPLTVGELRAADEVFLSGTTTEVLPVVTLDGRPVGGGRPGPLTLTLRRAYLRHLDALRER